MPKMAISRHDSEKAVSYAKREILKQVPEWIIAETITKHFSIGTNTKKTKNEVEGIILEAKKGIVGDHAIKEVMAMMEASTPKKEILSQLMSKYSVEGFQRGDIEFVIARGAFRLDIEKAKNWLREGDNPQAVREKVIKEGYGPADPARAEKVSAYAMRQLEMDKKPWTRAILTKENCNSVTSWHYLQENYKAKDRIAIVLIRKLDGKDYVKQEIMDAKKAWSPEYQKYLRAQNKNGYNVFVSMNTLKENALGRTLNDIKEVRHLYLDLDTNGKEKVETIMNDKDIPKPNYVLNTSPGKYQAIWKVEGISQPEAEKLQWKLQAKFGGDPQAKDLARVLRIPGFYNKKYESPHQVIAMKLDDRAVTASRFSIEDPLPGINVHQKPGAWSSPFGKSNDALSQSEYDWAYVGRRLYVGDSVKKIKESMASYRTGEKRDIVAYCNRTVDKRFAVAELEKGTGPDKIKELIKGNYMGDLTTGKTMEQYTEEILSAAERHRKGKEYLNSPDLGIGMRPETGSFLEETGFKLKEDIGNENNGVLNESGGKDFER